MQAPTSGQLRIVALVGPTGVGKTDLGLALASAFGAEIVNADSRQIFRHLDIGSAKPTAAQRALVPHHLVDVIDPDQVFDCAQFCRLAMAAVRDIARRGRRVLLVGGTGLYVKALLYGLFPGPSRDAALRAGLMAEERNEPGALHRRLCEVDPAAATRLHPHDHVRLVRALEVYHLTGRCISSWQAEHAFRRSELTALVLGVSRPRADLYARINARCKTMLQEGLIDEVRQLYAGGFDPQLPALRSPGYREIGDYVRGLCDLQTATARMAQATRRLAKRQLTWFRAFPEIVWCPVDLMALHRYAAAFWAA